MKNKKLKIKLVSALLSVITIIAIISLFVNSSSPACLPCGDELNSLKQSYAIHALPMPSSLQFAGEEVPMKKSYVRESFDREILVNTYWQSQTLLLIKRANRYFPEIEPILKEQGVPDDFKYLALIESGFMPRIVSPAGAAGIWQFMKDTAKEYGLEISNQIDERYHLEKSTNAACKYLKKAYNKFGSWTLAAAAYNAGMGGVEKQISIQKNNNYYELLLNEETSRYVFRILALKQILSSPEDYGFYLTDEDLYKQIKFNVIEIKESINNFVDFAKEHGVTYRELKDMNPWLRDTFLKNSSEKSYFIKIAIFER